MKYDLGVHIPEQMNNFLQACANGKMLDMERTIGNVIALIDDKKFQNDVDEYNKEREDKVQNVIRKSLDAIQTITESKDNDVYIDVKEIREDLEKLNMDVANIDSDYWDTMRKYILQWLKSQKGEE